MLLLTREAGAALIIADDIEIRILGVKGNQVRMGISAPKDMNIHRKEVFEKIKKELDKMSKKENKLEQ